MSSPPPSRRASVSRRSRRPSGGYQLSLQGAFQFADGAGRLALPASSQRLLAFLAFRDRTVSRSAIAGALWSEASEEHAHASLRSLLSRLDRITSEAVEVGFLDLRLANSVTVDIRASRALAQRLLSADSPPLETDLTAPAIGALSSELLPDWSDDWVLVQAEDWRQLRLHALDSVARRLIAAGRYADAIAAATAAIQSEPLRESTHAVLIDAHLAEGKQVEALATYDRYVELLRAEFGIKPTWRFEEHRRRIRP